MAHCESIIGVGVYLLDLGVLLDKEAESKLVLLSSCVRLAERC